MNRSFRLGLFVVVSLCLVAIGTYLIGERQFLFSRTYRLTTTFPTAAGLMEGADVRIGGIHQGTVDTIALPPGPDGRMYVAMNVVRGTRSVLRSDSIASIQTEGLLGTKFVEISFGSPEGGPVGDGTELQGAAPLDMSDVVKKANTLLDTTNQAMTSVVAGAQHFSDISAKIDNGVGTMGALVNDRKVFDQMNQTATKARAGATAFQENMEALKTNFFLRGFFSRRGYEDSTDLGKNDIPQLPKDTPVKTFTFEAKKIFSDPRGAQLKNESALNAAGKYLEANPFGLAVVVASQGMVGDSQEIHTLTQARAMVVRDYLVQHFRMDDTHVKTMGLGKNPRTPTDPGSVQVVIYTRPLAAKGR